MKNLLYILGAIALLSSCNNQEDSTTENPVNKKIEGTAKESATIKNEPALENNFIVAGKVNNGIHAQLVVEAQTPQGPIVVGETLANDKGEFKIEGNIVGMGIYQLRLVEYSAKTNPNQQQAQKAIPLTLDLQDSVYVKVDFNEFSTAPVYSGTEWAQPVNGYFTELFKFIDFQRNLKDPRNMDQEKLIALMLKNKAPLEKYCQKTIEKDGDNPANLILMNELYPIDMLGGYEKWDKKNLDILEHMSKAFVTTYPASPISQNLGLQISQLRSGYEEFLDFKGQKTAPEISMNDVNGFKRNLSDLKGKVVLIDFWASWCGPCRKENPNVVKMYNAYKNKGFEIFSVSLDKDANAWKRAIAADGLTWDNHVSDLKMWNTSVIQTYKFQGIPYTVLIDKNGEIIAKGLRGAALERKLKEILG